MVAGETQKSRSLSGARNNSRHAKRTRFSKAVRLRKNGRKGQKTLKGPPKKELKEGEESGGGRKNHVR